MSNAVDIASAGQSPYKRTTSAILKSVVTPRHQRTQEATASPTRASPTKTPTGARKPHQQEPLGEISHNRERGRPIEQLHQEMEGSVLRGKRTRSTIFTKGITGREKSDHSQKPEKTGGFKKSKSSTNLAAFLPRSKTAKQEVRQDDQAARNKENKRPIERILEEPPPIWAEFANKQGQGSTQTMKVPLNDTRKVAEEVSLYTPQEYSPTKARNFFEQPSLAKPTQDRPRSRHGKLDSTSSIAQIAGPFNRFRKASMSSLRGEIEKRVSRDIEPKESKSRPTTADGDPLPKSPTKSTFETASRGSRVKAAVAALSGRASKDQTPLPLTKEPKLSRSEIEVAFETMLVSLTA